MSEDRHKSRNAVAVPVPGGYKVQPVEPHNFRIAETGRCILCDLGPNDQVHMKGTIEHPAEADGAPTCPTCGGKGLIALNIGLCPACHPAESRAAEQFNAGIESIGNVRRSLFVDGESKWNGLVRDMTAHLEQPGGLVNRSAVNEYLREWVAKYMDLTKCAFEIPFPARPVSKTNESTSPLPSGDIPHTLSRSSKLH
jgi:hypothetical protein